MSRFADFGNALHSGRTSYPFVGRAERWLAIVGVLVGGVTSAGAVAAALAGLDAFLPVTLAAWAEVLLYRPAIVSVPLAFITMVVASIITRARRPADAGQVLLRLHAPERLGLMRDRLDDRG